MLPFSHKLVKKINKKCLRPMLLTTGGQGVEVIILPSFLGLKVTKDKSTVAN